MSVLKIIAILKQFILQCKPFVRKTSLLSLVTYCGSDERADPRNEPSLALQCLQRLIHSLNTVSNFCPKNAVIIAFRSLCLPKHTVHTNAHKSHPTKCVPKLILSPIATQYKYFSCDLRPKT